MTHVRTGERGIALAAAVFGLVVLAALLAGLWFAAFQEYRVGTNVIRDRRAFDAAEAGLETALAGWDARTLNRLGINDTFAFAGSLSGGTARYAGLVQRLGPSLFVIRSTGRDANGSSQRTLAVVARLAPLRLAVSAALVAAGPVRLGAGALVNAMDGDSGGSCAGAPQTATGIVLGDAADLSVSECPSGSCLRGSPPWAVDATLRGALVPLLGESAWAGLVAAADTVGRGAGPPSAAVVWYSPGNFTPDAGTAAGPVILLVQGDLVMETGAELAGLAVVRGRLIMRGSGGHFAGSVVAGGADLSAVGGARAILVHSACAVEQALAAAAPARPLKERSWATLY